MPLPTASDVHVSRPLTNISTAYIQDEKSFISTQVFPVVGVDKKADSYFTYDKADWFRIEAQQRAAGAESAGGGFRLSTDTYSCKRYSIHKDVDPEVLANADDPLKPAEDAAKWVARQLALKRESLWAAAYFTTGVWGTDVTGASSASTDQVVQWDRSSSTPVDDVQTYCDTVQKRTGYRPNVLVLGTKAFRKLNGNTDILGRIQYTQAGSITEDILARLFGVDKVVVARSIYNSAKEGASASMAWNYAEDDALLVYSAPNPGLMTPSAGYCFSWTGLLGSGSEGMRMSKFVIPQNDHSERVEGDMSFDFKVVGSDLGVFFNGITQ